MNIKQKIWLGIKITFLFFAGFHWKAILQDGKQLPESLIDTIYYFCIDPANWLLHEGYVTTKRIVYAVFLLLFIWWLVKTIRNCKYFKRMVRRWL